ncbi:vegetative cell wall protein gp1-like [Lolium rigidum]|uniref:vegetative cell wall protein gp1-like n=1 Tax=Lolium rigidum TaxID=89674 RepID=UPI001F5CFB80|nr:vegetative cell wall protein gp1-like [Lolium rigidum]
MSLVAYDASSDEEDAGEPPAAGPAPPPHLAPAIGPQPRPPSPSPSVRAAPQNPAPPPAPSQNVVSTSSSNVSLPTPSFELPDVVDLFDSPSLPSRGSAAMVGSSSRKRESNGSAIPPRSKFPRAQSAQPRGGRNAATNTLVPPQLSGRSNVVTEDMGKLFVARRTD